jgi:ribosome-associated protein
MRDVVVSPRLTIPAAEIAIAFARSGGPGGQNVNKVASKAEVRWHPRSSAALDEGDRAWLLGRLRDRLANDGALIVTSQQTRDQHKNRDDALSKLALIVRVALERPKQRRATRPTRGSKLRRVAAKRHRAEIKRGRRVDD